MRRTPKILIAIGIALGLAPLAVAIVAERPNDKPEVPSLSAANPSPPEIDRTKELRACRDRGAGALEDPACLALWDATRRRFFGVDDTWEENEGTRSERTTKPRPENAAPSETTPDIGPADGARLPPVPED